jgi:hypothetical protein
LKVEIEEGGVSRGTRMGLQFYGENEVINELPYFCRERSASRDAAYVLHMCNISV